MLSTLHVTSETLRNDPAFISTLPNKDKKLAEKMATVGVAETALSGSALLGIFGISLEGLVHSGIVMVLCSPAAVPVLVGGAAIGGYAIQGLENKMRERKTAVKH